MSIRTTISKLSQRAHIKGLAAALFTVGIIGFSLAGTASASAVSCNQLDPANDIVYCGVSSPKDAVDAYHDGVSGHDSAASIQNVYNWSGFNGGVTTADIDSMASGANGETTSLGKVTVDGGVYDASGKLVASNAISVGRENISNKYGSSTEHDNHGTIFYTRTPRVSFAPGVTQLSAYVVMKNGQFQFAIMTSCGNLVVGHATPPPPPPPAPAIPKCNCVKVSIDQTSSDDFIFHATGSTSGGATITGFNYTVLNAQDQIIATHSSDASGVWDYTNSTAGTYSVEAVAVAKTPSGGTITSTLTSDCEKQFTVPAPQTQFAACVELDATAPDANGNVNFTAIESHSSGMKMDQLEIEFGDGTNFTTTTDTAVPNTPNTFQATASHTYTQSATATLMVNYTNTATGQQSTSSNCTATITITPPPQTCSTNQVDVNGTCEVPSCANGGVTGAACVTPTTTTPSAPLPTTGASDDIPAAAVGLSSSITAAGYYVRSRRGLVHKAKLSRLMQILRDYRR